VGIGRRELVEDRCGAGTPWLATVIGCNTQAQRSRRKKGRDERKGRKEGRRNERRQVQDEMAGVSK